MGQKFAAHDAQGNITAFYDSIDSPPPQGAAVVEISDEEWRAAIATPGYTVSNGVLTPAAPPTAAQLLARAQSAQIAAMTQAYAAAISQDVSFTTAAGVSKTFQADAASQDVLVKTLQRCLAAGAVPSGFYWVAKDNTPAPFTLADLEGLDAAMFSNGWAAFQQLQDRKAAINAAQTVSAVQAVAW